MKRRYAVAAVAAAMAVVAGTCSLVTSSPSTAPGLPAGQDRVVERVVDGDTIVVDGGERVRFIGVDTPESVDPRRPVECLGQEASDQTKSLLPAGTRVRLVSDAEAHDRHGRTLAYVYRSSDGLFVNADLLSNGFAQVLTVPPNVAHVDEFTALQQEARAAQRGLWDPGVCP